LRPELLASVARFLFESHVRWFDESDDIVLEIEPFQMELIYVCLEASHRAGDATYVKCRIDRASEEVWIGSLQVAVAYRRRGVGREMVQAIEDLAHRIKARAINVYPLPAARGFWRKMGYAPHPHTTRLLCKQLA
jgi:GNAT superfamily N-acetyltransferase